MATPTGGFQPLLQPPISSLQPPISSLQPPISSLQPPIPVGWRSHFRAVLYACSRAPAVFCPCLLSVLSSTTSVQTGAEFAEIWDLAEEARRPIYPVHWPKDPQVKETFVQGAVLAAMLFTRRWLMNATRAVQAKRDTTPWRYWIGCLRNGLTETEGLQSLGTREEARSYFATLMNAAAPIALEVIAEDGAAELVPVAAQASPPPPLEQERQELRESLRAHAARGFRPPTHH